MTELDEIRQAVRRLCIDFPETDWVELANSAAAIISVSSS